MECYGPRLLTPEMEEVEGYVLVEDGVVEAVEEGEPEVSPEVEGLVVPGPVNAHTHLADGFLDPPGGLSLAELVGPGGFKHRALREASRGEIVGSMVRGLEGSRCRGDTALLDFREGGLEGLELAREAEAEADFAPEAMWLGRPVEGELAGEVVGSGDGLGLSGVNDRPWEELEAAAGAVGEGLLAVHAGESVEGQEVALEEKGMGEVEAALELEPDLLIHVTNPLPGELDAVEEAGVPVVLCPRSNARTGVGFPPVEELLEREIPLLLGSDNAMLVEPSVLDESRYLMERLNKKAENLMPILHSALFGGVELGLGSGLEEGKSARFAVLDGLGGDVVTTVVGGGRSPLPRAPDRQTPENASK